MDDNVFDPLSGIKKLATLYAMKKQQEDKDANAGLSPVERTQALAASYAPASQEKSEAMAGLSDEDIEKLKENQSNELATGMVGSVNVPLKGIGAGQQGNALTNILKSTEGKSFLPEVTPGISQTVIPGAVAGEKLINTVPQTQADMIKETQQRGKDLWQQNRDMIHREDKLRLLKKMSQKE